MMMPKDYAKQILATQETPKKKTPIFEIWVMISIIATIAIIIGWAMLHKAIPQIFNKEMSTAWVSRMTAIFHHSPVIKAPVNNKVPVAAENEIHFEFYSELPNGIPIAPTDTAKKITITSSFKSAKPATNSIVQVPQKKIFSTEIDEAIHSAMKDGPLPKKVHYALELGIFKDLSTANQQRISLLLAGVDAELIKLSPNAYALRLGTYDSESLAKAKQQKLQKKGITSDIKKID